MVVMSADERHAKLVHATKYEAVAPKAGRQERARRLGCGDPRTCGVPKCRCGIPPNPVNRVLQLLVGGILAEGQTAGGRFLTVCLPAATRLTLPHTHRSPLVATV